MSVGGWIMITISWAMIISLSIFCMRKVMRLRDSEAEHLKTIYQIDTGDLDEDGKKGE